MVDEYHLWGVNMAGGQIFMPATPPRGGGVVMFNQSHPPVPSLIMKYMMVNDCSAVNLGSALKLRIKYSNLHC